MNDKRPVSVIREGTLAASVWERNGRKGRYFEFTLSRAYRTDDSFKYSSTFHERDAEALGRVISRAAEAIRRGTGKEASEPLEQPATGCDVGANEAPAATGETSLDAGDSQDAANG